MSPNQQLTERLEKCFPRVSGDEPVDNCLILTGRQFSPRERG